MRKHLAPGRHCQEMTVPLPFPEGSPQHFPTPQRTPMFADTTSGPAQCCHPALRHHTSAVT